MYDLNEEQRAAVDEVAALADEVLGPNAEEIDDRAAFPEENIEALADAGFLGLTVPEEFGGMGLGLRTSVAVLDEIGQRCPSTGMIYLMHLAGIAAYNHNPEVAESQLRAAADGDHLTTLAWSEFGSRSHFWAPVSKEEDKGERVEIDAQKSWVTAAGHADGYVVSTGWADGEEPTETMLYLVEQGDGPLDAGDTWDVLGLRGNSASPMQIDGLDIPKDRTLCEPGAGMEVMLEVVLPVFQLGNAAISLGISEAACEITRDHITGTELEHEGKTLADLPKLRERVARMRIETDKLRAHLESVVTSVENPGPKTQLLVLESKASASDTSREVTEIGMKACGGAAYGKAIPLERFFRDARASHVMAPSTDVLHDFVGKAVCGMEVMS